MISTVVFNRNKDAPANSALDSAKNFIRIGSNNVDADPLTDLVHWYLVFIVTPTVSIIGFVGNTMTLIVLAKQGFHKSVNILLFNLAISDILFMVGVNGPPKPMYEWGAGGFQYPELTAHVLYYLYHIFDSLNWGSGSTSLCNPRTNNHRTTYCSFLASKIYISCNPASDINFSHCSKCNLLWTSGLCSKLVRFCLCF